MSETEANKFLRARMAFGRARAKSVLGKVWATIHRRPHELLAYDEVREHLHAGGPVYRGLHEVPISQIVGSVNRYRDFDRAFLPSQARTEGRWESIERAHFDNVNLPPVKLYKIGDVYFVVDGNHRVSVAREMGQEYIDAEVQEVRTRVPLSPDVDPRDLEIIGDKAVFLTETKLDETRPQVDFNLKIPGGYGLLLEHIRGHKYLQSVEWSREFTLEEAAAQWCDQVYLPMVDVIHKSGILRNFPGHTEGDLYIWLIEHQYYLKERYGSSISFQDAVRSFSSQFSAKSLKRAWHWVVTRILHMEPDLSRLD
jgi:hypothetical protein